MVSFDDFEVRIGHFEVRWDKIKLTLGFVSDVGIFEVMLTKLKILRLY